MELFPYVQFDRSAEWRAPCWLRGEGRSEKQGFFSGKVRVLTLRHVRRSWAQE